MSDPLHLAGVMLRNCSTFITAFPRERFGAVLEMLSKLHHTCPQKKAALPHLTFHLQVGSQAREDVADRPNEHPNVPAGLFSIPSKVPASTLLTVSYAG